MKLYCMYVNHLCFAMYAYEGLDVHLSYRIFGNMQAVSFGRKHAVIAMITIVP